MVSKGEKGFTERLVTHLRELIPSKSLLDAFRRRKKDFIRQRLLSFARVIGILLTGSKMSLQGRTNKFFTDLGETGGSASAMAFVKARDKICPEVFKKLTHEVTTAFYEWFGDYGTIETYNGRRLVAIDASDVNIPDSPETRDAFTLIDNKSGCPYVQAQTSYLCDVLNDLVLSADIGHLQP